ncbi:hypothetical protein Hdeb2414_s0020g00562251 [Helianthus debilis subsp. tardiflorus]
MYFTCDIPIILTVPNVLPYSLVIIQKMHVKTVKVSNLSLGASDRDTKKKKKKKKKTGTCILDGLRTSKSADAVDVKVAKGLENVMELSIVRLLVNIS